MPQTSIVHEICHTNLMIVLRLMSSLSGHKTYSDIIGADVEKKEEHEIVKFNVEQFSNRVHDLMKENNYF